MNFIITENNLSGTVRKLMKKFGPLETYKIFGKIEILEYFSREEMIELIKEVYLEFFDFYPPPTTGINLGWDRIYVDELSDEDSTDFIQYVSDKGVEVWCYEKGYEDNDDFIISEYNLFWDSFGDNSTDVLSDLIIKEVLENLILIKNNSTN